MYDTLLDSEGTNRKTFEAAFGKAGLEIKAMERFTVVDQISGATYEWGQYNTVRIDPYVEPAHIFVVRPHN